VQLTQARARLLSTPEVTTSSSGQLLVPAALPSGPSEPDPLRAALLGLAAGLLAGLAAALLRDHLDDAIQDEDRLRHALERPVLGRIPQFRPAERDGPPALVSPHGAASEAFRALGSSVRFLVAAADSAAPGRGCVLLVTSAQPGEGKSTVAANLAVTAARFGLRVTLVDGDLRNPTLAHSLGLGTPPGLSDALANHHDVEDMLIPGLSDGLTVLTAGSATPNPAELLASASTVDVFARLRASSDLVVVDSPPALGVSDALQLVAQTDLVLLVARHATTRTQAIHRTVEMVRQVGGEVSGLVYNAMPTSRSDAQRGYGYDRGTAESHTAPRETA